MGSRVPYTNREVAEMRRLEDDGRLPTMEQIVARLPGRGVVSLRSFCYANDVPYRRVCGARADLLTPRQEAVFELVAVGMSNGQIADATGLSRSSVNYRVVSLMRRLGISTRGQAALSYVLRLPAEERDSWLRTVLGGRFGQKDAGEVRR